jgi:hypothetical protein
MATVQLSNGRVQVVETITDILAGATSPRTEGVVGQTDGIVETVRVETANGVKFDFYLFDKQTGTRDSSNNIVKLTKAIGAVQITDLNIPYRDEDGATSLWFEVENTDNSASGLVEVKLYIASRIDPTGQAGELIIPRR